MPANYFLKCMEVNGPAPWRVLATDYSPISTIPHSIYRKFWQVGASRIDCGCMLPSLPIESGEAGEFSTSVTQIGEAGASVGYRPWDRLAACHEVRKVAPTGWKPIPHFVAGLNVFCDHHGVCACFADSPVFHFANGKVDIFFSFTQRGACIGPMRVVKRDDLTMTMDVNCHRILPFGNLGNSRTYPIEPKPDA